MLAAACFVAFRRTNHNDWIVVARWLSVHQTLCTAGFFATHNADSMELRYILGLAHQIGHGAKRLAPKIEVQTSQNDTNAAFSEGFDHIDQPFIKELGLINADNGSLGVDIRCDLGAAAARMCIIFFAIMRGDLPFGVADINRGFKHLNGLAGNVRPPDPSDQLFSFSAEHAAAYDFNAASMMMIHRWGVVVPSVLPLKIALRAVRSRVSAVSS